LEKLPKTLDETYERILQGIPKMMQTDAHRIFQWLMVSSRPLRVEEVAEVFAINFDEEMCGIPVFDPSWRDANAETAILSACSTLVTVVVESEQPHKKIVQFSHCSVQEYLTSDRIPYAEHVSRFHLRPKPAHTLLAKACLSVLLHLDYSIDEAKIKDFPLAEYAAKRWVKHAQFEDVLSYIGDGMDLLFDKDKPHFATWVWLSDIDLNGYPHIFETRPEELNRVSLYYAALCGFHGLVERLLTAHPQDLDVEGGKHGAPLNAALAEGHLNIAQFLMDRGAVGDTMGFREQTGLYIASSRGYADVVRSLIDHGANLNARCEDYRTKVRQVCWTPLHAAIDYDHPDIALLLLEGGANPETRSSNGNTVLCMASSRGHADVVRWLIGRDADLNAMSRDWAEDGFYMEWTPLHAAIYKERRHIVPLLLGGGANTEARSDDGETALYLASSRGCADIVRQLLSRGADPNAECKSRYAHGTPLHVASCSGSPETARVLLEHGANPNALNHSGGTALHLASEITVIDLLLEYGAIVDVRDQEGWTPLHKAAHYLNLQVVVALLSRGADPHAQTNKGKTPFQLTNAPNRVSKEDQAQIIQLLSERAGETI
jgi:ankyrin repeat protein